MGSDNRNRFCIIRVNYVAWVMREREGGREEREGRYIDENGKWSARGNECHGECNCL